MNQGLRLPVSARRISPVGLLLLGVSALALGLFAVGPGHLYRGDTWPDYLAMLAASVVLLAAFVDGVSRDRAGTWSWRRLRGPSFALLGLAVILLAALSAVVPVESGVWAEGDSALGFSMFTFCGSVVLVVAATVKAPRSPHVSQLTWDPAVMGARSAGVVRIALRRYRFLSRRSYVDVDLTGATLVVPRVFGGRRAWFVPMQAVGVVLPDQVVAADKGSDDAEDWVTRQEFRVPYLSTTTPFAAPNLTVLFTHPQPIPPLRWFAGRDLDISPLATRRASGPRVDGVELRVVEPEAAIRAFLANGACGIGDPDAFVQRHRDIERDPERVRAVVTGERQSFLLMVLSGMGTLTLFVAFKVTDDERYGIGLSALLGITYLLERVARRRSKT
ncbi:MAG: hypothetical protein M3Y71_13965 [Actinomycetota bacterium]|nr:hypothetical protein [Actinomycetota bacterium]